MNLTPSSEPLVEPISSLSKRGHLPVGSVHVTEKCRRMCGYCAIDAKPDGKQMPWKMIQSIVANKKISFMPVIHLGDGEVTAYHDKDAGKKFVDVLELFVRTTGRMVGFTTAGMVGPDAAATAGALHGMLELDRSILEHVSICVSFNLLGNEPVTDVSEGYLRGMMMTAGAVKMLEHNGSLVHWILGRISDLKNLTETRKWFELLVGDFRVRLDHQRTMCKVGRATGMARISPTHPNKNKEPIKRCSVLFPGPEDMNSRSFTIRPQGDVSIGCGSGGSRNSRLGNLFENNPTQILHSQKQFMVEHLAAAQRCPKDEMICEFHRKNQLNFQPVRSRSPIISGNEAKALLPLLKH